MIQRFIVGLLACLTLASAQAGQEPALAQLVHDWDIANFTLEGDAREKALGALVEPAARLSAANPGRAEPLVWEAIVLSSYAGAKGGLGALKLATRARDLLLEAEKIDPAAADGSIYTSLGSLYYRVPGWPIGFGDEDRARVYLEKALNLNPDGLDANYFYGDFLIEQGEYRKAVAVLEKAMNAPSKEGRPIADQGRRKEIATALAIARKKAGIDTATNR